MTCCPKIKNLMGKAQNIAQGYTRLLRGQKCACTDDRIRVCQKCADNYWIGRSLWCSICKCFIPAKARVDAEQCPLGQWKV